MTILVRAAIRREKSARRQGRQNAQARDGFDCVFPIWLLLTRPLEAKLPAGFNPEAHLQTDVPPPTGPSKWNVKEKASEERALEHLPLDQISVGTQITEAQKAMEKAGFKCWDEHDDFGQAYMNCSKYLHSDKGFSSASLVSDEIRAWIPYEAGKVVDLKAKEFLTGP